MSKADRDNRATIAYFLIGALLLWGGSGTMGAVTTIIGDWDMTMEFGAWQSHATLSLMAQPDGSLTGRWGASEIGDVRFEGTILSFVRTVQWFDKEFIVQYQGTLKDGKLIGTLSGDHGAFPANGARPIPKLPVLGQWLFHYRIAEQDISGRLVVQENVDATLQGTWAANRGEHSISNLSYEDGKLTFLRKTTLGDRSFATTYEGSVHGHTLTGNFGNQQGQWVANAERVGADLIGKWILTTTSEKGTYTRLLTVYSDLAGRYESFGGELPIDRIDINGEQVSFQIEIGFGDRTFVMEFRGMLKNGVLEGELNSSKWKHRVAGTKID